ncbi:GNAT family N-acetyltransferase [Undibacterium sp. TS12]|uniref:GNAT family N-acetyltransferase n=1 Tax=Undibacterium sp. TS12 TaxID=2908202 RepID=UPI001F4C8DA8|nr:GNAT family N-acetyltransferase [Undibacterium sp. TS12]
MPLLRPRQHSQQGRRQATPDRQSAGSGFCHPSCVVSDNGIVVRSFAAISVFHSLADPMSQTETQLFMKELYIRSSCRSCGLGKALMKWIASYALSKGCARMDWTVNSSNHAAQDFYHSLAAAHVADRWHYRMTTEGLSNLASRNESRFHD